MRRLDSIRNKLQRPPTIPNYGCKTRSNFALRPDHRERNFWMRRQGAKNRHQNARTRTETKIRELSGRESPQKRPIWRRMGNVRFAETGWWCAQSDTNQSPRVFTCYWGKKGKSGPESQGYGRILVRLRGVALLGWFPGGPIYQARNR